jgi:hypothetical protein
MMTKAEKRSLVAGALLERAKKNEGGRKRPKRRFIGACNLIRDLKGAGCGPVKKELILSWRTRKWGKRSELCDPQLNLDSIK